MVEVLASLMLVAIVLPVAMRGVTQSAQSSSLAADRIEATMLAERQMQQLLASQTYDLGSDEAEFDDFPRYHWKSGVNDWGDGAALRQVSLTVQWTSAGRERQLTLNTLVRAEEE